MDAIILICGIFAMFFAGYMIVEVRDIHYLPFWLSCVVIMLLISSQYIPPNYLQTTDIIVAILTIIVAIAFIRDLWRIDTIQNDSDRCLKHAEDFLKKKTSLKSESEKFRNTSREKKAALMQLENETNKSMEEMSHG